MKTIDEIADAVHANAREKGFHIDESDDQFLNNQLLNLHDEISELHEAWRHGKLRDLCDKAADMGMVGLPPLTCAEEEYADIVIRVLDQCRRLRIDIARAIDIKHRFNQSRSFRHGGKKS